MFEEWLEGQLTARNWRPIDLARAAGLSGPTVTRVLNGDRKIGPDAAVAIARALGVSPVYVFQVAGLLPPEKPQTDRDPTFQELLEIMKNLSPDERREVVDYALFRYRRQGKNGKG